MSLRKIWSIRPLWSTQPLPMGSIVHLFHVYKEKNNTNINFSPPNKFINLYYFNQEHWSLKNYLFLQLSKRSPEICKMKITKLALINKKKMILKDKEKWILGTKECVLILSLSLRNVWLLTWLRSLMPCHVTYHV